MSQRVQDYATILIIVGLSLSVFLLMLLGKYTVGFPFGTYYPLPMGWFIGATMAFLFGKWNK